jgi:hypothetical protein
VLNERGGLEKGFLGSGVDVSKLVGFFTGNKILLFLKKKKQKDFNHEIRATHGQRNRQATRAQRP